MDVIEVRRRAVSLGDTIHEMIGLIEQGFMENRMEPLDQAMACERQINDAERELTGRILEISRDLEDEASRRELLVTQQMIETFERMGDEASGLVERFEIKVSEKLLFSDQGVAEFKETYAAMRASVDMMRRFLRGADATLKERVIDNGFHVKELVERFRKEHTDRLLKGICNAMAANLFFDILDLTGNLARHASNVVKLF